MATTNFGALLSHQEEVWTRELWREVRHNMFLMRFVGSGPNAAVQRITELTRSSGTDIAIIRLLGDLREDGTAGDNTLKGREEAGRAQSIDITIDQLRHAMSDQGRMTEQRSVIKYRTHARSLLAFWMAERLDQLGLQTLAGRAYDLLPDGTPRAANSQLKNLAFASRVTPPSNNRRARWNSTTKSIEIGGATTDVTTADKISWEMLVQIRSHLKTSHMRGIRMQGGDHFYHVLVHPHTMANLKLDDTYMQNLRHARSRDGNNPLFMGNSVMVDGLMIHENEYVPSTLGMAPGSKWGVAGNVEGAHVIFLGAQAMALADLGKPYWNEEQDDYGNRHGISVGKILGFHKPQFTLQYSNDTIQDFGVFNAFVASKL
jgi:N4-gp56 family major capsid protein